LAERNISGYVIHSSVEALENLTVRADYHGFFRSSDDFPIYKTDGTTSLGSGAASSANFVASEVDLTLKYQTKDMISLSQERR